MCSTAGPARVLSAATPYVNFSLCPQSTNLTHSCVSRKSMCAFLPTHDASDAPFPGGNNTSTRASVVRNPLDAPLEADETPASSPG